MSYYTDRAVELFKSGFNCSQAVFAAFADKIGMPEETALRVSAGLGGGVGRMREVCGAVCGAAMLAGMIYGATEGSDRAAKAKTYEKVQEIAAEFQYEMCVRMTGKSHTDPEARDFALAVMKRLNDKCGEWKVQEHISYSVYGTPMESTTYKFAKCLQKRFGVIQGVTDKNYITNSYHIHVTEEIDAFSKLSFESEFQKLSPGGAISYVEVPNMQDNIPAVLSVMRHIYENIMYAELNTKSDFCDECGYSGEVVIKEDDSGKLMWQIGRAHV